MIGKLKGFVDSVFDDHILFDVNSVCYTVYLDKKTINRIGQDRTEIFIEYIYRETGTTLFGFLNFQDQCWFRELIKLNGISGKIAMSILGSIDVPLLGDAIRVKDEKLLSTVPGIGKKLASRIVNEMDGAEEKVATSMLSFRSYFGETEHRSDGHIVDSLMVKDSEIKEEKKENKVDRNLINDALSGLANLGFNRSHAYSVVQQVLSDNPEIKLGELIKESLKKMAQ